MTKVRYAYLQNNLVLADAGEVVFDIGLDSIITRLDIRLQATNGATNNKAATPGDAITEVDVMNGSQPIVTIGGNELMGMSASKQGRWIDAFISEVPSAVQYMQASIDFGRWYCDEQQALDLSKFPQCQIRFKWNLAAIRAVGATGFVSGTGRLTIIAHILEGSQNPLGYLSLKRHAAIATAASGDYPFILPLDKPIRAIGIRSVLAGTGQLAGVSNVRLNLNERQEIPFDLAVKDLLESLADDYGEYAYVHKFHGQDANTLQMLLKYKEIASLASENQLANAIGINTAIGEETLKLTTMTTGAALAVDTIVNGHIRGYLPFGTAYIPFGTYDDPNTWFQAQNYKSAKLEVTQNAATAALSILLEQLNMY